MYKRILVPLDGSRRAEAILSHVEELAQELGAEILFMQVLDPDIGLITPYDMVPYYDEEAITRMRKDVDLYLQQLVADSQARGNQARRLIFEGPIVRSILEAARQENADLIAMASHGRTGLARVFYGSVAAGVLQQADRPLLIIRTSEAD
ncbi:MAG: universal stress protein [Caldilineaceae bacterium]|nr:universal stress protein [Caldilineaceae bacterium]MCB9136840.1 universal stress protein [Caldilineaceae bacterium]